MSAPDTDPDKQEREHKPSLLGIKGAMIFGVLMLLGLIIYTAMNADEPTADAVTNTDQAEDATATVPEVSVEPGTND